MRVALFDLEMSNLNADYGMVLCAVVKPYKEEPTIIRCDDMPSFAKYPWLDTQLAKRIRDELEQYDIIVSWNGVRFDIPFLNARLMQAGATPMKRVKHIDLLYQARFKFKLSSNSLANVQEFLHLKHHKTAIQGNNWTKAMRGSRSSMDYIVKHCVLDVQVLEETYDKMKGLVNVIHN
jgi:uncharacterized protein YprB with RNaseH-like and TPR domain